MKSCEIHKQECSQKEERRVFFEADASDHYTPLRRVQWLLLYFYSFGVCHFGARLLVFFDFLHYFVNFSPI